VYKIAPDAAALVPNNETKFVPLPVIVVLEDEDVMNPVGAALNCKEYPTVLIMSVPLPDIAIDWAVL
jgi:hypothetical protein